MPGAPSSTSQADPAAEDVVPLWEFFQAFLAGNRVLLEDTECHREICETYEAAVTGQLNYDYIICNMPRRIGKTKILEALPAWMFGEFDGAQMLYGSYTDTLVKRTIRYVGATMRRQWYKDIYGDLVHTKSANLVTTTGGGTLYGAGTTATVVGYGAGLKEPAGGFIALDDPSNADAVFSKIESKKVIDNFENTWKGCRNSDRYTPIIINAQRLGPDDLPGYIRRTYPNRTLVLKFPAFVAPGPGPRRPSIAPDAVPAFPMTWSRNVLEDSLKTRIGRYVLASQMQQEPIALGGNLIQTESFKKYTPADVAALRWDMLVITVDTALKVKEANDYSCFQLWGRASRRAYLLDQAWGKWESPELKAMALTFWAKSRNDWPMAPLRMIIEEKAAGTPLLQQLRSESVPAEGIERDLDKVRRVQSVLPHHEAGLVYVPAVKEEDDPNHWVHGFLMECAEFKPDMTHAHDDRVDCFADGVNTLLGKPLSILELMGAPPRR